MSPLRFVRVNVGAVLAAPKATEAVNTLDRLSVIRVSLWVRGCAWTRDQRGPEEEGTKISARGQANKSKRTRRACGLRVA